MALADFLPAKLGGVERFDIGDALPPPEAYASYVSDANGKVVSIILSPVTYLESSRAQFHGLAPGQTKNDPANQLALKGFVVAGYRVERTRYLDVKQSEARALLADKVDVVVSVAPTDDADEAVEVMKQLDLAGLEAFAKTL